MKKFGFVVISYLFILQLCSGQALSHRLGEIMFEVANEVSLHKASIELEGLIEGGFNLSLITSDPMQIWKIKFDPNLNNEREILDACKISKNISKSQFNHIIKYRKIPDDQFFGRQWQYINSGSNGGIAGADIDMEIAWDFTIGGLTSLGDTIVACIIDDGLHPSHLDFEDNLWLNHAEIPNNGIDDDNNGYVDDFRGWNTYVDNDNINFGGGHGTSVAGIVGAKGNNGIGVSGVNWDVKLMIISGGGDEANALSSYAYPYMMRKKYNETNGEEGAFVVSTNASWGTNFGQPEDAPIWCSFYDSLGVVGILNCGATINANVNVDVEGDLPTACSSDYLIAVTNMNRSDNKVNGAGYGSEHIDLGAFGESTYTVQSPNQYGPFGGTSGATPHVTGSIALLYALPCEDFMTLSRTNPGEAALYLKDLILLGTDQNESLNGITSTGGRLNVGNSMIMAFDNCSKCKPPLNLSFESGILETNVHFDLAAGQDSSTINMRYREKRTAEWIEINEIETAYEISGLMACASYELQIKSRCDSLESSYIRTYEFQTEGCCEMNHSLRGEYMNSSNSLIVTWEPMNDEQSYILEYRKKGAGWWQAIETVDLNFELSDLEACSQYEFRLQSECLYDTSAFNTTTQITTPCGVCSEANYCTRLSENETEFIQYVQLNALSNLSGPEPEGYGDFVGVYSTTLEQGVQYDLLLAPGYTSQFFDEYFHVWLDWNQDSIFSDEELAYKSPQGSTGFLTAEILVPEDAIPGYTRMRIVMNSLPDSKACEEQFISFGETEDYCVEIIENLSTATTEFSDSDIYIYPNPTRSELYLKKVNGLKVRLIEILDLSGNTLSVSHNQTDPFKEHYRIEGFENLAAGLYLIQMHFDDNSQRILTAVKY